MAIKYRLVYNNIGPTPYGENGAFVSLSDRRRKIIGLAMKLEGSKAKNYNLIYAVKLKNIDEWSTAQDEAYCGQSKGKGPAIEQIKIILT